MQKHTISLTGHRPNGLWGYNKNNPNYLKLRQELDKVLESHILKYDTLELHSGMALGADTIWAQAIVGLKERYKDTSKKIIFVADIPDHNQSSRWFTQDQIIYKNLIKKADYINIYKTHDINYNSALYLRNLGMINACDTLIAIKDENVLKGGTINAIREAQQKGVTIFTITKQKIENG